LGRTKGEDELVFNFFEGAFTSWPAEKELNSGGKGKNPAVNTIGSGKDGRLIKDVFILL